MQKVYGCPVEFCLDVLGGKWKPVLMFRIRNRPQRYRDLRNAVTDLSDKVLTEQLRGLQDLGFVERGDDGYYRMTEIGLSLGPVLQAVNDWGKASADRMGVRFRE